MSHFTYSASESDEGNDNCYCVLLHIVEGIGLNPKEKSGDFSERYNDSILMHASLNGVKFEVEGQTTETTTIFNSNCIWECELEDIKRMKTDNRPVKMEYFIKHGSSVHTPRKLIGSLLLPVRGVQTVSAARNLLLKLHWHKLGALSTEWRKSKPEIYLLLIIIKKTLLGCGQLEKFMGKKNNMQALSPNASETAFMLQSQNNVYVQLLEQLGLIQVGNNPDVDCEIFKMTLTFKQVRNVSRLLTLKGNYNGQASVFVFNYDFLGSNSHSDVFIDSSDCYNINERISLHFKSSVQSLRAYFERVFYVPLNLIYNGVALATYRLDFSKLLPDDPYFNINKVWIKNGNFSFESPQSRLTPCTLRPSVDFIFIIELLCSYTKKNNLANTLNTLNGNLSPHLVEQKTTGDRQEYCYSSDAPQSVDQQREASSYDDCMLSSQNFNKVEYYMKNCEQANSQRAVAATSVEDKSSEECEVLKSQRESSIEAFLEQEAMIQNAFSPRLPKKMNSICIGTEDEYLKLDDHNRNSNVGMNRTFSKGNNTNALIMTSIAVNTDPTESGRLDTDELTLKIVQELEQWKAQQMKHFLTQLEAKETAYLNDLGQENEQQRKTFQAELSAKMTQCEELNAKLEKAHAELNANANKNKDSVQMVDIVKRDIERCYAEKFETLDREMQHLKVEIKERATLFETQNRDLQIDNAKLQQAKAHLKQRIEQLEKQLASVKGTHLSADQLRDVLTDLRVQNERFIKMEKSKNYYKEQWSKTACEVNKLKLTFLKQQKQSIREPNVDPINLCLEEILSEEQDNLSSHRSELKSMKHMFGHSTDTASSTCDPDDDDDSGHSISLS